LNELSHCFFVLRGRRYPVSRERECCQKLTKTLLFGTQPNAMSWLCASSHQRGSR
jgi:hypothetical protein